MTGSRSKYPVLLANKITCKVMNKIIKVPIPLVVVLVFMLMGCSATKYVPQADYLLKKNKLVVESKKNLTGDVGNLEIEEYIQQRPNKKLFGVSAALGFYNATDTAKNNWWQRFWRDKMGEPPVILDSTLLTKSTKEIELYLISNGYFNSQVTDTFIVSKKRKATVVYNVVPNEPYRISELNYDIQDKFVEKIILGDKENSLIKIDQVFQNEILKNERFRIVDKLKDNGFWGFNVNNINFKADSSNNNNTVKLTINVKQHNSPTATSKKTVPTNHHIYRYGKIVVNTSFDPTASESEEAQPLDTIMYNGVAFLYNKKMIIRPKILYQALRLSPNGLYDQSAIQRASENVRMLNYNSTILFNPIATNNTNKVSYADDTEYFTFQDKLDTYIQCTPNVRQSFTTEFEASSTNDYFSTALSLGYVNRNIFGGAEVFTVDFRGAYEFVKITNKSNSYEFGVTMSIEAPRFWLPITDDAAAKFKQATSKISLNYNVQKRPDYDRTLIGAVYGYSWTLKNGARFTINPADVNVVDVPRVDSAFLANIENPFLRNSYTSQLIAGASASYNYTTPEDKWGNVFSFRVGADVNGNLISGLTSMFGNEVYKDGESYRNLFGMRFAQYARASFSVSGRTTLSKTSQIAWRFMLAGGYAYGNSNILPFERRYFAGGSNSMRGWQVRTLGPGSSVISQNNAYPNQLGDMQLEANFEYRAHIVHGLGLALFFDTGNIWSNSKGETDPQAKFHFDTFYKQLALNTGVGVRYNIANLMTLRLDWGFKLHNPGMPEGHRWFTNLNIDDTALHFAIGLPF